MFQRTARATAVVITLSAATGCSSSPTTPDPQVIGLELLPAGSYQMYVQTSAQQAVDCIRSPAKSPFFGVATNVTVSIDGRTWIARSPTAADGDIELRLRYVGDEIRTGNRV